MVASFSPGPLPSSRNVYVPGPVARLTPANPYQQWHALLERNENSCPRKLPRNSVNWSGAVISKSTGEPFTSLVGSQCAIHFRVGAALAERVAASSKHRIESRGRKGSMKF